MKICFNRLSPYEKFEGKYSNGDVVEIDDNLAKSYIASLLAFEIKDEETENRANLVKKQTEKNKLRRLKAIQP